MTNNIRNDMQVFEASLQDTDTMRRAYDRGYGHFQSLYRRRVNDDFRTPFDVLSDWPDLC